MSSFGEVQSCQGKMLIETGDTIVVTVVMCYNTVNLKQ